MPELKVIILTLNGAERVIIKEAIKHYMNCLDLEGEEAETINALKRTVKNILGKMK